MRRRIDVLQYGYTRIFIKLPKIHQVNLWNRNYLNKASRNYEQTEHLVSRGKNLRGRNFKNHQAKHETFQFLKRILRKTKKTAEEEAAATDRIPRLFFIENRNHREYHRILQVSLSRQSGGGGGMENIIMHERQSNNELILCGNDE